MLFYDGTESRSGSRLPKDAIDYGYAWGGVEAETGADFIVTGELSKLHKIVVMSKKMSPVQISEKLGITIPEVISARRDVGDVDSVLYDYLYLGSIAVQRKSGSDLISSIQGSRLKESLSRLDRAVPFRSQRMLLYTGVFSEKNGNVVLDGKETGLNYMAFAMAITAWCNRGGTAINLANDNMILDWVKLLEKQLMLYKNSSEEHIYTETYYPPDMPQENELFQLPVEVKDWRRTMVTFPKMGPEKVNALRDYCELMYGSNTTLWNAMQVATSDMANEINGWGSKSIHTIRDWLGIPDGFELVLQLKDGMEKTENE